MIEQQPSSPRPNLGIWGGVLIGIGTTLLVLLLIVLFSFLVLGRCPMCEWMMGRAMRNDMMRDGMMDNRMMDDAVPRKDGRIDGADEL